MNEPTTFRAGDSAGWTESLPDYPPAGGWLLKYRLLWLVSAGAEDIAVTSLGDEYRVSLTSAATSNWVAGAATLVKWVEQGGNKITLGQIAVTILPDLTTAITFDNRSANSKALADAEAALAAHLQSGQLTVAEYEISGRKMKFRDTQQILDLINHYKRLVAKERAALALLNGGSMPGRVFYRG